MKVHFQNYSNRQSKSRFNFTKLILITILLWMSNMSSAQAVSREFFTFIRDMTWKNYVNYYGSYLYPLIEPWIAIIAVPIAYDSFVKNKKDLEYIGYDFDHIYDYALFLTKKGFYNFIDPFTDNGYPLIPEAPEYK